MQKKIWQSWGNSECFDFCFLSRDFETVISRFFLFLKARKRNEKFVTKTGMARLPCTYFGILGLSRSFFHGTRAQSRDPVKKKVTSLSKKFNELKNSCARALSEFLVKWRNSELSGEREPQRLIFRTTIWNRWMHATGTNFNTNKRTE